MDRRESATALAFVRIACAVVLLGDQLWVHHVGLVEPMWSPPPAGFGTAHASWSASLDLSAYGLWGLAVASLTLVMLGVATRPACLAFALVSAEQSGIAPNCETALDTLMRIVFVVLALSRCNAKWSFDALVWRVLGRPMPVLIPAWPRYVLMLQLLWVYFSAAINKSSAGWGPHGGFSALGNALLDPHNGRLDPDLVVALFPLTRVATALTMAFELTAIAYVVLLYYAATPERGGKLRAWCNRLRLRWVWLGLGIAFEIGIAIGLQLGTFPFGMLALFPVLLLPAEVERLARPVGQWRKTLMPAKRASSPS
jgi:hypothetical protein